MRYKRKLIIVTVLLFLVVLLQYLIPGNPRLEDAYNHYIFKPYQSFRNLLFGYVPVSIGDMLYIAGSLILIAVIIRWIYFLFRFSTQKQFLAQSLLNTGITLATLYILFFIGWGGNYYKPSLVSYWQLDAGAKNNDSVLKVYDQYLIDRLNHLAPAYEDMSFRKINQQAQHYYKAYTNNKSRLNGLRTKPSVFGYFMQYLGIQGYYNPFTGEAQVNRFLPSFMLPFVVCHEMAHQNGIAAEDDANLIAYALCVLSPDKDFSYSGYFNIWLYTHNRLRMADSTAANQLITTLNPLSHSQLDTLRAIRRRYRSKMNEYSSAVYDRYLRLHNQKNGIDSYYGVVLSAWAWEEKRKTVQIDKLNIP